MHFCLGYAIIVLRKNCAAVNGTEGFFMKLLHTGDLHLDSPFCALGVADAQARREGQRRLLRRIFDCAKTEACDLILIAGDLFDGKYVTPETEALLLRLLRETPCHVVIAPGNHDPFTEDSFYQKTTFPERVHVFSAPTLQAFEFPQWNAKVYGYAFCGGTLAESPLNQASLAEEKTGIRLLCAHGDMGAPLSRYCPMTVCDIVKFNIHYAALGHVHTPDEDYSFGETVIRYCGVPEGRSFDEPGEGGVWIVTLEEGVPPRMERRILSEEQYETAEVDVSQCHDRDAVQEKLREIAAPYLAKSGMHLRVELIGTLDPEISFEELAETNPLFSLRNFTVPALDGAALSEDVTLRGALYRILYPSLVDERPETRRRAIRALQIGLAAIDERRIPTEEDMV